MYRTLQNVCKEMNRKNDEKYQDIIAAEELHDLAAEPGVQLDVTRSIERIRKFTASLPNQQREVVVLRIFEGFSVKQTANILGCRSGTVKAHLHKAIANLRRLVNLPTKQERLNNE